MENCLAPLPIKDPYRQCLIGKEETGGSEATKVVWLPEKLAKIGRVLPDDYVVKEVYEHVMAVNQIAAIRWRPPSLEDR
jgi:hypothetical protein